MAQQTPQATAQPREGPEAGRQQNRVIPAYSAEAASAAKAGSGGRRPTAEAEESRHRWTQWPLSGAALHSARFLGFARNDQEGKPPWRRKPLFPA